MPDYFKPVRAGDKLDIKAPTWNAMLDAARAHQNRSQSGGGPGPTTIVVPDVVMIHNGSGGEVGPFSVLGIDGVKVEPGTDLQQFLNAPLLKGVTPTALHLGKFVVTLNRIAANSVGRAVILGATVVKVDMKAEGQRYADATVGSTAHLTSSGAGPARILYTEAGTGVKWALVRIGGGGSISIGEYRGMVYSMVADKEAGWEFLMYTPWTPPV